MFGLGHAPELFALLLIAVLILGPKRLPEAGRGLGRAIRNFRSETEAMRDEVSVIGRELTDAADAARTSGRPSDLST